jgi:multimeric flavodoxin WrbA
MANLLIHDLRECPGKWGLRDDVIIVADGPKIRPCKGCFNCWIKTPAQCTIHDDYADMGFLLAECDHLILVSQCFYGGYSPFVSNVLNRSIPYLLPYFAVRDGEARHPGRYAGHFDCDIHLYGKITAREKETAQRLAQRNRLNLLMRKVNIHFYDTADDIGAIAPEGNSSRADA